jgi:hypothetical protein
MRKRLDFERDARKVQKQGRRRSTGKAQRQEVSSQENPSWDEMGQP